MLTVSMRRIGRAAVAALLALAAFAAAGSADARRLGNYEQAMINILKEYMPPDYVDGVVRQLDEVDARRDLTLEEKAAEQRKILDKEVNRATKAEDKAKKDAAAGGISDPKRAAEITQLWKEFRLWYLGLSEPPSLSPELRDRVNAESVRIREEREKAEKEKAEKEAKSDGADTPKTPEKDGNISFESGFSYGVLDGPSQLYLAIEPVLGTLINGAVAADDDFALMGGDFSVRYQPEGRQRFFKLEAAYYEGDTSREIGTFDPVGNGLGLPGTGDTAALFPNGVFFRAFGAANLDVAQDLLSTYDYELFSGGFSGGHPAYSWGDTVVSPFAGISFAHIDQEQTFSGRVPAYNVGFAYETDYDITRYSGRLGTRIECADQGKRLRAFAEAAATFNWTDLDGSDSLSIVGPVSDLGRVNLDDDEFSVGYSAELGVTYDFSPRLQLRLGGRVEHGPAAATLVRPSLVGRQSEAEIKSATSYVGRIGISYSF